MSDTAVMENPEAEEILPFESNEQVRSWRLEKFKEMGFNNKTAQALSETQVDVWHMRNYLDLGCSPVTACRLLVGVTRYGDEDEFHSMEWFLTQIDSLENLTGSPAPAIV